MWSGNVKGYRGQGGGWCSVTVAGSAAPGRRSSSLTNINLIAEHNFTVLLPPELWTGTLIWKSINLLWISLVPCIIIWTMLQCTLWFIHVKIHKVSGHNIQLNHNLSSPAAKKEILNERFAKLWGTYVSAHLVSLVLPVHSFASSPTHSFQNHTQCIIQFNILHRIYPKM